MWPLSPGLTMDADDLRGYTIRDSCPMDWSQMAGDERSRFCGACGKHVYDLTVLSSDERPRRSFALRTDRRASGFIGTPTARWRGLAPKCGTAPIQLRGESAGKKLRDQE